MLCVGTHQLDPRHGGAIRDDINDVKEEQDARGPEASHGDEPEEVGAVVMHEHARHGANEQHNAQYLRRTGLVNLTNFTSIV